MLLAEFVPDKIFYETFSTRSKYKTYEQFKAENPLKFRDASAEEK
jgi:hypothetical protein